MDMPTYDQQSQGQTKAEPTLRALSCDQIAWLKHVLERYEATANHAPAFSRSGKAAKMAALLEIMEITGCTFLNDAARHNAISDFPELYQGARAEAGAESMRTVGNGAGPAILKGASLTPGGGGVVTFPSPSANAPAEAQGSGADANSTAADGPPPRAAEATSQGPDALTPENTPRQLKKPRKKKEAKKAKAKREKKVKVEEVKEVSTAEAIGDELPHTEPKTADEPAMDVAA